MVVHIYLHATIYIETAQGPLRSLDLDLPEGSTLLDLLARLPLPLQLEHLLLAVNSRAVDETHVLHNGDQVNVMPALSGG